MASTRSKRSVLKRTTQFRGQRGFFQACRQRLTLHHLHHQVIGTDVIQRADVRWFSEEIARASRSKRPLDC
jgi:hypothetical protein